MFYVVIGGLLIVAALAIWYEMPAIIAALTSVAAVAAWRAVVAIWRAVAPALLKPQSPEADKAEQARVRQNDRKGPDWRGR